MAFPTVVNTAASSSTTGTTLSLTMPASLVAGRLLLCIVYEVGTGETPSLSGWTSVLNTQRSGGGAGTGNVWVKIATGSDTGTISGVSTGRLARVYQISGWSGTLSDVKAAGLGTGTSFDPPNLAAPFGADDCLWITTAGASNSGVAVTAAPTNYTNLLTTTATNSVLGSAERQLNASSEDPGTFSGTPSTSPIEFTICVPPVETFGDITFAWSGTAGYSATNPAVAYPASIAANDLLVLIVGQKPATAGGGGVTTPTNWTLLGSLLDAGGYATTVGADVGNMNLFVYTKVATGSETGSITITTSDNSVAAAWMHQLTSAVGNAWDVAMVTGSDTTAGSVSVTMGSDPGVQAEDYILGAMVIPTDVTTPSQFSAEAFSQTGVTFGTVREVGELDSALGNQLGGFVARARVLSGTSSAAPVMTATAGGTTTNVRGPAAFIRTRRTTTVSLDIADIYRRPLGPNYRR